MSLGQLERLTPEEKDTPLLERFRGAKRKTEDTSINLCGRYARRTLPTAGKRRYKV